MHLVPNGLIELDEYLTCPGGIFAQDHVATTLRFRYVAKAHEKTYLRANEESRFPVKCTLHNDKFALHLDHD